MKVCARFPLRAVQPLAQEHVVLVLHAPPLAERAQPGQFLHVRCTLSPDAWDPLLRRPFSLYWACPESGEVAFLVKVVGRGSAWLAQRRPGEELDVLGPLGRPFTPPPSLRHAVLVGGGVGMPPLYFLASRLLPRVRCTFLLGARTAEHLLGVEECRALGAEVLVATEDGSQGFSGTNVDLLQTWLLGERPDWIAVCGPWPMMAAAAQVAAKHGLPGQASLEARMGCGLGACLSCVVRTTAPGWKTYQRVCTEGPVFDLKEVIWSQPPW